MNLDIYRGFLFRFFFQDIFYLTDVSQTGTLSLSELRNAFSAAGRPIKTHSHLIPFVLFLRSTQELFCTSAQVQLPPSLLHHLVALCRTPPKCNEQLTSKTLYYNHILLNNLHLNILLEDEFLSLSMQISNSNDKL